MEGVRVDPGKNNRQSTIIAIFAAPHWFRRNVRDFAEFLIGARELRAIENVGVQRIDGDVAIFKDADRMPLAKCNFAVVAVANRTRGAAFLLRAVHPIRIAIIRGHVIELGGRLVVPGTPGCTAIHTDDRALIAGERNDVRIFAADPDALVIIAARSAFETGEGFPGVTRLPRGGICDINEVRIVLRDGDAQSSRPATANALVAVDELPGLSGVVGAIDPGILLGFHGSVDAIGLRRSDGDADAAEAAIIGGREALGKLAPIVAAIGGFVQAASFGNEGFATANFPGSDARGPENRINRLRIVGIESQIGGADIFVFVQNLLKRLAAIGGTEGATAIAPTEPVS